MKKRRLCVTIKKGALEDNWHNMTNNSIPTIIVVDDSPSVKTLFERAATDVDMDVDLQVFDSCDSAWDYLQNHKPNLLFLNIRMPRKDGLTFLEELRGLALHKDTPVVMISSKDYAQDRAVASKLGALDFITKPVPIRIVTRMILKYQC